MPNISLMERYSQHALLKNVHVYTQKNETRFCTKINFKWIKDLNVRLESLQRGKTLQGRGIGFLSRTPVTQEIMPTSDKHHPVKLKRFSIANDTVMGLTEGEKIFVSYTFACGSIFRI